MRSIQVTVGTEPTLLVAADDINREIHVHALSNTTVYLGAANVTTSTGFVLEKDDGASVINVPIGETIYAVVANGTEIVSVLLPNA